MATGFSFVKFKAYGDEPFVWYQFFCKLGVKLLAYFIKLAVVVVLTSLLGNLLSGLRNEA